MSNKQLSNKRLSSKNNRYLTATILIIANLILSACSPQPETSKLDARQSTDRSSGAIERVQSDSLSSEYALMRSKQVSNVDYQLSMVLNKNDETFSGKNRISFTLSKENINPLTIDFDEGEIESILVNGEMTEVDFKKDFITIPKSFLRSGQNEIIIKYQHSYVTDGSGLHRFVDPENGEVYLYSDFEPYDAHRMFPHFDQPDIKATYTLDVIAPANWKIITATRESKIDKVNSMQHWFFPQSAKISSYVFSLHAGNYFVWNDQFEDQHGVIPLRLFVRQSLKQYIKTENWFKPTKQSFQFFNQYFEIPYPFGKYDQIIAPDFNSGAMENVAAVTFSERYVSRGGKSNKDKFRLARVISHEMAHMWFGDLVTMRWWNGLWLNESFATYMSNLQLSEASDFDGTWDIFYNETKQWAYQADDSVNTHSIELPVATTVDAMSNFDGITYGKGASVLKQLPYYLGHENFRKGVSNYLKKYAYANTDLQNFIDELANASGKDLTQWSQDWLYKTGLNTIEVEYQCEANKISEFKIVQTAPDKYPTLREQKVQIGFYRYSVQTLSQVNSVDITYKGKTTLVDSAIGLTCPDLVYPNNSDWGYVKVVLDEKSLITAKRHINSIESSTLRAMLWQNLSDSVRDAQLSADEFVDFSLKNIKGEKNYNVVNKIASSLISAMSYLNSATIETDKDYSNRIEQIETVMFELLSGSANGSDEQKLWFLNYLRVVVNKKHLNNITKILSGELVFDGLEIEQDRRWRIISKLNRYQFGNYKELLVKESKQDKSDKGEKYSRYAEASRPDMNNKEKWFEIVTKNPNNLNLSSIRYIIWSLFNSEQYELQSKFTDRIFAHSLKLNSETDLGLLRSFAGLLPANCNTSSLNRFSDMLKVNDNLKPQLLKSVKRKHQNIQRCIKVLSLLKAGS